MGTAYVRARVVQWLSDEPFPGVVRVELVDRDGKTWLFEDKVPMFDEHGAIKRESNFPLAIKLACTVMERRGDNDVLISTAEPWGIETRDGQHQFLMRTSDIEWQEPRP